MWHVLEKNRVLKDEKSLPPKQRDIYSVWKLLVAENGPSILRTQEAKWHDHALQGNLSDYRSSWLGSSNWRVVYQIATDEENVVGVEKLGKHSDVYRKNSSTSRPREPVRFRDDGPWYPSSEVDMTAGEILVVMREIYGMSQEELSSRADISQSNLSAIERGRIGLGVQRARRIADAFGVSPGVFLR